MCVSVVLGNKMAAIVFIRILGNKMAANISFHILSNNKMAV
jgi:hypothetical protein